MTVDHVCQGALEFIMGEKMPWIMHTIDGENDTGYAYSALCVPARIIAEEYLMKTGIRNNEGLS